MVLGCRRELVDRLCARYPGGERIEDVEPFEGVAVRDRRGLGRLLALAGGGGVPNGLEGCGGGGRRRVGAQPPLQCRGIAHRAPELGHVAIDHTLDVARELASS
jgi:hypothetical protein